MGFLEARTTESNGCETVWDLEARSKSSGSFGGSSAKMAKVAGLFEKTFGSASSAAGTVAKHVSFVLGPRGVGVGPKWLAISLHEIIVNCDWSVVSPHRVA